MRIGELAELAGVTTRTVRHYHRLGLLPEPPRLANGYREYGLRDAVALTRVRRLAELGLPLDEIADVLADDRGRDLREVIGELDAELARRQRSIETQRERLAALLAQADLNPDSTIPADLAAVLQALPPAGDSPLAQLDRELFTLIAAATDPAERAGMAALFQGLSEPAAQLRGQELYTRLDQLADADPGDPDVRAQVVHLAADLAAHLPAELADAITSALARQVDRGPAERWLDAVTDLLAPAQAEVLRQLFTRLAERRSCA